MVKTMQHSSTCSAGSWELSVRDGAQKKLNYWSSDWKYRFAGFRKLCSKERRRHCGSPERVHVHRVDRE